jgi:hypothetical protein
VRARRWLAPADFAETIGLCQVLPGPNIGNASIVLDHFREPDEEPIGLGRGTELFGVRPGTARVALSRMVAAGEWRDYGISTLRDVAIFSVFRRTAEHPLYRIEKRPKLRTKQGLYAVIAMDGQVIRRGHDLGLVLKVLERKLIRTVD